MASESRGDRSDHAASPFLTPTPTPRSTAQRNTWTRGEKDKARGDLTEPPKVRLNALNIQKMLIVKYSAAPQRVR